MLFDNCLLTGQKKRDVSGDPIASQNGVFYLLSDHLGSSSVTTVKATDEGPDIVAELRYKPWGENRYSGYSETATSTTGVSPASGWSRSWGSTITALAGMILI